MQMPCIYILFIVWLLLQVGVFSATLPPEALEITRKFMNKPVSAPAGHVLNAVRLSGLNASCEAERV
jgi:superfamily II DNA/RNA helicase